MQLLRSCGRLCAHAETSFRVSRQVVDVPIVQVVVQLLSRSWHLVPQIMEEIVEVSNFCDAEQIVASRATDHGRNR